MSSICIISKRFEKDHHGISKKAFRILTMLVTVVISGTILSCEEQCPECEPCEEIVECELTDWGVHVREELISLFLDVEDLALCQVWSADSQTRFWSGYGSHGEDSREVLYDFLNLELVLTFRQYVNGKWTSSMIRLPYNLVIMTVLQYVTRVESGMVVRRANNILIYMSNEFDSTDNQDGVDAMAIPPSSLHVTHEKLVLEKNSAPTS